LEDSLTDVAGYESCPYKYLEFFLKFEFSSDWYVFVDDDTYIHTNRLEEYLNNIPNSGCVTVGLYRNANVPISEILLRGEFSGSSLNFPRGGAGFAVSLDGMKTIQNYLRNTERNKIPMALNSDTSIAMWMDMAGPFNKVLEERFCRVYSPQEMIRFKYLSCHYVSPKQMFEVHRRALNDDWR